MKLVWKVGEGGLVMGLWVDFLFGGDRSGEVRRVLVVMWGRLMYWVGKVGRRGYEGY